MNSDVRQLNHTLVFLRTSFEAIQHSIAGRLDDPLPCWLDTGLLSMLSRELIRSHGQAQALSQEAADQLRLASERCHQLLQQCPGVLSSTICYRQLAAIILPLEAASHRLEWPAKKRRWFRQRR